MQITVKASRRTEQGSRASRRLRRAGRVPGIVYGGDKTPQPITLDHNELYHQLNNEAFHASILTLEIDGERESVLLRDTQWHAYKPLVLHVDFQRVSAGEKIHLNVPLHFVGGENSPAVKLGGCIISHVLTEIEVRCLPKDLPEYITVDLSNMQPEQSLHLSQLELPPGVEAVHHGEGDPVVATALKVRGESGPEGGETTES